MAARVPARLTPAEGREFGLVVGGAFLLLAGLLAWRGREAASYVLLVPGVLLMLGGLLAPTRLGPARRGWMGLAHAISRVTTPIVLGVIYFLLLTPVGLAMRALGRDPLRAPDEPPSSWWVRRPDEQRSRLERQF